MTKIAYTDILCSACPFSGGKIKYLNSLNVGCSKHEGVEKLPVGYICPAMNEAELEQELRIAGGAEVLIKFLKKKQELMMDHIRNN